MDQIRSDMKTHKRMYSADSENSMRAEARSVEVVVHPALEEAEEERGSFGGDTEIINHFEETAMPTGELDAPDRANSSANLRVGGTSLALVAKQEEISQNLAIGLAQISLSVPPHPQAAPAAVPDASASGRPTFLSPGTTSPVYPVGSLHGRKEDMTRFVSSSTASSGTAASAGTGSFVKHQGPKHITHISPNDLPPLPDRVGKMVFDRQIMKWVKATKAETSGILGVGTMRADGSNESEDPFRDIESIRDDDGHDDDHDGAGVPAERGQPEQTSDVDMSLEDSRMYAAPNSEPEDAEEAELMSFSFDIPSVDAIVRPASKDAADSQDETEEETVTSGQFTSINLDQSFANGNEPHTAAHQVQQEPAMQDTPPHMLLPSSSTQLTTPQPVSSGSRSTAPASSIKSALKSGSGTPVSAMKDPSRGRLQTPANKLKHRRSVSFSDGKRDGQIAGLGRNVPTPDNSGMEFDAGSLSDSGVASGSSTALIPSARSKRIADMLENLENTCECHSHSCTTSFDTYTR